jgi:Ca-activated chloride channel homolog
MMLRFIAFRFSLLFLVFFFLSSRQVVAQEQELKVRTDLVSFEVLVREKDGGRLLGNLSKEDFTVYEDGVRQTLTHCSQQKLPLSLILLVDRAGCINAFDEQIRAATIKALSGLQAEDEVAIFTFSSKVNLVQPFTRERQLISEKITTIEPQHHSEQHYFNAGIYEAASYMSQAANPIGRRVILVLTSLEASIDFSRRSQKDALHAVLESGAVVSGMLVDSISGRIEQGIRGKPTSLLRHIGLRAGSLKMFVAETGGELLSAPPTKIEEKLEQLIDQLAASYSLAYVPTNPIRDGKRRRLRVELVPTVIQQAGKVVLRTRRSYLMPKEGS